MEKEPLSDQALADLIAGVGNRENKAITLVLMGSGSVYTKHELYKTLRDCQGQPRGWNIGKNSPFAFCKFSLEPSRLVAEVVADTATATFGYIKTGYGQEFGTPLAAVLLDFSLRHPDICLYGLFGETKPGSKKSEEITVYGQTVDHHRRVADRFLKFYRIFKNWILEDQKFREENPQIKKAKRKLDLIAELGADLNTNCLRHADFEHLHKYGIISYDSVDQHRPFVAVRMRPDVNFEVPYCRKDATLSKFFFKVMANQKGQFLTLDEITALVVKEKPAYLSQPEEWQKKLRDRVGEVATYYKKQGCVEVEKFDRDHKSEIKFTLKQEQIILELMDLLERFQRLDPEIISKGHRLTMSFTDRQFAQLMKKAKDNSPCANDLLYEQAKNAILSILRENPDIGGRPLLTALRNITNSRLAYRTQGEILKRMRGEGLVKSTDKRPRTWSAMIGPKD